MVCYPPGKRDLRRDSLRTESRVRDLRAVISNGLPGGSMGERSPSGRYPLR